MASVIAILSIGLGTAALIFSFLVAKMTPASSSVVRSADLVFTELENLKDSTTLQKVAKNDVTSEKKQAVNLTTFEKHCLGVPLKRLFRDCDDIGYVIYNGKRCTTVEAVLLTGYLYHGEHVYQASSVMLLLVARVVPRKVLRTFNMLLLRWHLNPKEGTLSEAFSCTWYHASKEDHKLAGTTPVA